MTRFWFFVFCLWAPACVSHARAAQSWPDALAKMPLPRRVQYLTRTNCVPTLLAAFQPDQTVKALVFMPGATDEFYMFRRATAELTNPAPSLLDAVIALTNQTFIRATFRPPLLLLHTDEDPLEPGDLDLGLAPRQEDQEEPSEAREPSGEPEASQAPDHQRGEGDEE